jgi:hypothetical protein
VLCSEKSTALQEPFPSDAQDDQLFCPLKSMNCKRIDVGIQFFTVAPI